MKPAIKERHHFKYHHQMVFHITVPSNIINDMTRMPLGTLGIKFREAKSLSAGIGQIGLAYEP